VNRFGVVLLSGGLDSATVATLARREGCRLFAVTVRYGQRHCREVEAARAIAERLGIPQRMIDGDFFREVAWYSALTQPERFAVPSKRNVGEMGEEIPTTYVPLRNTFLITLAAALLESEILGAMETLEVGPKEITAKVFVGANSIDYSGYPDCRPEYYEFMNHTLRLGSKLGAQYGVPMVIETPIIRLSKAEIVRLAIEIGAPLELTWSCYEGGERPCGLCDSCQLRARAFEEVGIADPGMAVAWRSHAESKPAA